MRLVITENQYNQLLATEADYPASFDMNEFRKLTQPREILKYAHDKLQRLGAGSSRVVYQIDDNTVLKIAKHRQGIIQNSKEADVSQHGGFDELKAMVFDYHRNYLWIEMELGRPTTEEEFEKILGVPFDIYANFIQNETTEILQFSSAEYVPPEWEEKLDSHPWVQKMLQFAQGHRMVTGDLAKINSYGVIEREGEIMLVLVDYGIDERQYANLIYR